MNKFFYFLKFMFAVNALSFAILLCFFVVTLFFYGLEQADNVWNDAIYFIIAWSISILICIKYLDR